MKVAILGLSDSTRRQAPWDDPSWELWGLGWDAECLRFHRVYEMHDLSEITGWRMPRGEYFERLGMVSKLYMQAAYQEVPNAIAYPFDEVARTTGDYWSSSLAYPMAQAIHEGATEIGLYGIDMAAGDEYGYQKPNMEYLIGFAKGRGITVHVPAESPLCRFKPAWKYERRYGTIG